MDYKKITTPAGKAFYAHLYKPAVFEGEEKDFEVNLVFDDKYTEKLKAMIAAEFEKAKEAPEFKGKKWKKPFFGYSEKDEDDETYAGATVFKFKMKPIGKNSKTGETFKRKVAVFDAKGKPIVGELPIGNKTIMKVCATICPYHKGAQAHGIGLYMEAVQIIELVEYTGTSQDASGFGFKEEEGFDSDDVPFYDGAENGSDDDDSDDDADF